VPLFANQGCGHDPDHRQNEMAKPRRHPGHTQDPLEDQRARDEDRDLKPHFSPPLVSRQTSACRRRPFWEYQDHSSGVKISGRNSGYFEKRPIALANPRHASSRNAGRIDAVTTARDQQCTAFKRGLARHVCNGQGVTAGAQREAMDERVFSLHGDCGGGMGEKLKPMPTPLAPQDSSHQSFGRNHRRVVRQDERPCSPDLHSARNEISICTPTKQSAGVKLGIGSCKIADLTEGSEIRLKEYLPCAKCLEVDPHLAVFHDGTLKTASSETEVNGQCNGSVGDHGHGLDGRAQP
jgi:hypothetical protein